MKFDEIELPTKETMEEVKVFHIDTDGFKSGNRLTYKDVEIDSGKDLVSIMAQKMAQEFATDIETQGIGEILKCTQKFGIVANEEKVIRWAKMCQFLEESATDEDKKAIGVLIHIKNLEEQLAAKDERIEKLIEENRQLQDRIESAIYTLKGEQNDWGDDDD